LNEGLLLSFENNTNLDWMGYSLDGQNNVTILGNTTIPMLEDGQHVIQVFSNNSFGNIFQSERRHFSIDTKIPEIIIDFPSQNGVFGRNAPDFNISIIELNLNTTWYTLDGGITNITFSGLTGTINQTEWEKKGNGMVTIRFYGNDSIGLKGTSEVSIYKDIIAPISSLSFIPYSGPNIVNKSTTSTITADDGSGSGVSVIRYKINDSDWFEYNTPFDLSLYAYGDILISYQAIDEVGNIEEINTVLVALVETAEKPTEGVPLVIILIAIISTVAGIAVATTTVVLLRRRKRASEVI